MCKYLGDCRIIEWVKELPNLSEMLYYFAFFLLTIMNFPVVLHLCQHLILFFFLSFALLLGVSNILWFEFAFPQWCWAYFHLYVFHLYFFFCGMSVKLFAFLFVCIHSIWKFPDQRLSLSCSCELHRSYGNARSFNPPCRAGDQSYTSAVTEAAAVRFLTHCTTAGTPLRGFYALQIQAFC